MLATHMQLDSVRRTDSPLALPSMVCSGTKGEANLASEFSAFDCYSSMMPTWLNQQVARSLTLIDTPHQRGDLSNHRQSKARGSFHYSCEGIAACGASGHVPRLYFHAGQYTPVNQSRYLISKCLLQMLFVICNMGVTFVEHRRIRMTKKGRHGDRVMSLDEFFSCPAMPAGVHKHARSCHAGEPVHPVTQGKFRPCGVTVVTEQLAAHVPSQQPCDYFQRDALQVNNALHTLALGFFSGENNALSLNLYVTRFNGPNFLWTSAAIPSECENIPKWVIGTKQRHNSFIVHLLHVGFATLRSGLLHARQWAAIKMPLLYAPIPHALHGDDSTPAVGRPPCVVTVHPLRNHKRLYVDGWKLGNAGIFKKAFEMSLIPFAATFAAMFLAPEEILGCEVANRNVVHHKYMPEKASHFLKEAQQTMISQATGGE